MPGGLKSEHQEGSSIRRTRIGQMFDRIAHRYDLLNRLLSGYIDVYWRSVLVKKLSSGQAHRILDVATGTGDLAIALAKQWPKAEVTGLDISEAMLERARQKATRKGLNTIAWVCAPAESLPFADQSFDMITVGFGVRNFADLQKGLSEMHRVLRKGGKVGILEFSMPRNPIIKKLYGVYFRHLLPRIGALLSGDSYAYRYLYETVQHFPAYEDFASLLYQAGFSDVEIVPLSSGICCMYLAEK